MGVGCLDDLSVMQQSCVWVVVGGVVTDVCTVVMLLTANG